MKIKTITIILIFLLAIHSYCTREKAREKEPTLNQSGEKSSSNIEAKPLHRRQREGRKGQTGKGGQEPRRFTGAARMSDFIKLSEEEKNALEIETERASWKSIRPQLSAMGKVFSHPLRRAIVSYPFPARISKIHVQIGEWVQEGQILLTLQSEEVGKAKSEFYKASADYELAKVNFERAKRLYDQGAGAKKDYLSSEAQFKVAETNLDAAEKKLHLLGFTEENIREIAHAHEINPSIHLFSPISGKIIENKATLGALVDQNEEILTVMDPSLLCIDAEIYEKDISQVAIGQEVEVTVPAYPEEIFMGKISYIGDILKEETRTATVRTEVKNKDNKLKPGMFANIKIFLKKEKRVLVVPKEAVLDDRDKKIVFLKKEGGFIPRVVEIGASEGNFIEIMSGIEEGEEVVTRGSFQLKSKLYEEVLRRGHVH